MKSGGRESSALLRVSHSIAIRGGLKPALLFFLLALLPGFAAAASGPEIRWRADAKSGLVEVIGLSPERLRALTPLEPTAAAWVQSLAVFAEQGGAQTPPPMLGAWRVAQDRLVFESRFPLARGVRYRAEYRAAGAAPLVSFFELPADTVGPTTSVAQIYPSGDVLPHNQLKFYVQFSAPMSRGGIYEHIRLHDGDGRLVDLPFLELDEELWDRSMTRLTLLVDPGRIKRGVKPLEDVGPVFEEGKSYTLSIADTWRDAEGRPLRAPFRKIFRVGAGDRTAPEPMRWKVRAPAAGTREPLVVDFDEPMDWALALRMLAVVEKPGAAIAGEASLAQHERRWTFVPATPWPRGPHLLVVPTTIEDLAGNNVGKTFDVDVAEGAQRQLSTESVTVPFEVR